jgi:VWFA-related protein
MFSRISFICLPALFCLTTAFAQQPSTQPPVPDNAIHLDVVVTPKSGQPVADLQQQDFTVLDNNTANPITSFKAVTGSSAPVEVVIVIDAVNTSYQNIAYERQQISKFLRDNGGHLAYPTTLAVITDTGSKMQQAFSTDGNAIDQSLSDYTIGLRDLRRSSGFYGASERLQISLNAIRQMTGYEAARPGRKIILWISPGWPILSGPGVQLQAKEQQQIFNDIVQLSTEMRKGRITLYSLDSLGVSENLLRVNYYQDFMKGVKKASQTSLGNLSLQVLAVQSGGQAYNSSGLAIIMQKSLDDCKAFYEVTIQPLPAETRDEYHQLEVKVAKAGLVARTRTGYYAEPAAPHQ